MTTMDPGLIDLLEYCFLYVHILIIILRERLIRYIYVLLNRLDKQSQISIRYLFRLFSRVR